MADYRKTFPRPVHLGLCLVAILVLAAIGFKSIDGFGENVYSELVGILISALIAVLLVERILDRREAERWKSVREQTRTHLLGLAAISARGFWLGIPLPAREGISDDPVFYGDGLAEMLEAVAKALAERSYEIDNFEHCSDDVKGREEALELLESLREPLSHLINGLGPRIYASDDPELIALFAHLIERKMRWETFRNTDLHSMVWIDAAMTAEALANLVRHISPPPVSRET